MKAITLWLLVLISAIALPSCKSHQPSSSSQLWSEYFLLTPDEVKQHFESTGFKVKNVQLTIYHNRPVWLIDAEEDNFLMEIYGSSYFVPEYETRLTVPTTEDIILYHGRVLYIRDDHGLYLELEE